MQDFISLTQNELKSVHDSPLTLSAGSLPSAEVIFVFSGEVVEIDDIVTAAYSVLTQV